MSAEGKVATFRVQSSTFKVNAVVRPLHSFYLEP